MKILNVNYHWYYDLVFRTKYNFLVPCLYIIDFLDYVKAGIAYNTRSYEISSRKISFFATVYEHLCAQQYTTEVASAIKYFYEDLFCLYKQYFISVDSNKVDSNYIGFLSFFEQVKFLCDIRGIYKVDIQEYVPKDIDDLLFAIGTPKAYDCSDKQLALLSFAFECVNVKANNNNLMEVFNLNV